ncbi:N-acetylglucosaminyldiphosphoundecaprenol N-acetyl-beta-D-mannosaminyltransferase [Massilia sp. MP_M2]|uniref:WecB/TagA/CpsF family glycosyltransferase n=1 Tax=Massilia sp. MP_M2 TaxID=3071713 RepID=UPI00319DAE19
MTVNNPAPTRPDRRHVITDFTRPVYCVLGLPFDALDMQQTVDLLLARAGNAERCFFSTPNLNFLITSQQDPVFRDSVLRSSLSLADGMPVVWLARLLGLPFTARVAGATVFERLRDQRTMPVSVFFFGGPDGVAQQAADVLNAGEGRMRCVGAYSPGFGTLEEMSTPAIIERINASHADLLVVSLGAKRGQAWIEHNLRALDTPLVSHLGAVVNFVAGTVSRAPALVGRLGLEWLWRIKEEPALWRRYWGDGVALVRLLTTRALPAALDARRLRAAGAVPVLHESDDGGRYTVTLGGAWRLAALGELRLALARATARPRRIHVALRDDCSLDSAALGLLLLLYGHQSKTGNALSVDAASASLRRTMRLQNVEFLLQGLPGNTGTAATGADFAAQR